MYQLARRRFSSSATGCRACTGAGFFFTTSSETLQKTGRSLRNGSRRQSVRSTGRHLILGKAFRSSKDRRCHSPTSWQSRGPARSGAIPSSAYSSRRWTARYAFPCRYTPTRHLPAAISGASTGRRRRGSYWPHGRTRISISASGSVLHGGGSWKRSRRASATGMRCPGC